MRFAFEAIAASGAREQGELVASDDRAALKALAARGLTVLVLTPLVDRAPAATSKRLSAADRALAVRQLSGMIDGGVPLPSALSSVAANSSVPVVAQELSAVNAALAAG